MAALHSESIAHLSDEALRARVIRAAATEREATADLIALLAEFDRRQLYLAEGSASLFVFCTGTLHLSESAAYTRIQAARAARKFPQTLNAIRGGLGDTDGHRADTISNRDSRHDLDDVAVGEAMAIGTIRERID